MGADHWKRACSLTCFPDLLRENFKTQIFVKKAVNTNSGFSIKTASIFLYPI